jgi:glycosyltransferase involved in cell wall biosynthesis
MPEPAVPAVSVVVATHNQARWLGEAIESVRAQSFRDWELVVVDDGSTDDTAAVAARFADDPRIRYLAEPHRERAAARNRGIAATTGRLVAFLDADDVWLPEKLARQVAAIAARPDAVLCYTPARYVDEAGRPLPVRKPPRAVAGDVFPRLVRANLFILASVLVRRACLLDAGCFDATLAVYGCEDWDLWLRLTRRWPVVVVDEELTHYRRHDGNTAWSRVLESAFLVIDKVFADPQTARRAGISRAAVRALHCYHNATPLAATDRAAARELVRRGLREAPASLFSRSALAALAAVLLPPERFRALQRRLAPS